MLSYETDYVIQLKTTNINIDPVVVVMVVSFVLVDELATAVQMKRNEKAGPIVTSSDEDTTEPPTKRTTCAQQNPLKTLGAL